MQYRRKPIVFASVLIVIAAAGLGMAKFATTKTSTPVSPASVYDIPSSELESVTRLARAGDCRAAHRLSSYYMNAALNFDRALEWGRVGARCPAAWPKETLLALLMQLEQTTAVVNEIEALIGQISTVDKVAAERAHKQLADRRRSSSGARRNSAP